MQSPLVRAILGLCIAGASVGVAHVASANPSWDGPWGSWAASGSSGYCLKSGYYTGYSVINGNDSGQVIAYCDTGSCGGPAAIVHAIGCTGSNGSGTCEYTGYSYGSSVGSTAGGSALASHRCQEGTFIPN